MFVISMMIKKKIKYWQVILQIISSTHIHVTMVTLHQPMITNMFIVVFIVFLGFEDLM